MRKLLVLVVLAGVLGAVAGEALADRDLVFTGQPHRHYIDSDPSDPNNAWVEVGPRYCDNLTSLAVRRAFTQFHANTHTHFGVTGEQGPVAPGLHKDSGHRLVFGPC